MSGIPRGNGEPGTWRPYLEHTPEPEYRMYWTASVRCPKCHARMSLSRHNIGADGSVTPSIGHPNGVPDCGWHPSGDAARLIGWEEVIAQGAPPAPSLTTCARCDSQSRSLGGWGTDGRYVGIVCDKCIRELRP